MNKKRIIIICVVLGILLLSGVIIAITLSGPNVKIGYAENNIGNKVNASFYYFNGTDNKKMKFDKGDKVTIKYSIELDKGALQVSLIDKDGKEIFNKSVGSGEETFTVNETQSYLLEINATKAKGKYNLVLSK